MSDYAYFVYTYIGTLNVHCTRHIHCPVILKYIHDTKSKIVFNNSIVCECFIHTRVLLFFACMSLWHPMLGNPIKVQKGIVSAVCGSRIKSCGKKNVGIEANKTQRKTRDKVLACTMYVQWKWSEKILF